MPSLNTQGEGRTHALEAGSLLTLLNCLLVKVASEAAIPRRSQPPGAWCARPAAMHYSTSGSVYEQQHALSVRLRVWPTVAVQCRSY